jgi:hypothetical protein
MKGIAYAPLDDASGHVNRCFRSFNEAPLNLREQLAPSNTQQGCPVVTDLVREASFLDFRDALREVWPDLPDAAVEKAWKLYTARLQRGSAAGAASAARVPKNSLSAIRTAFSKRDLPMKDGQVEELAIEILKGWA